MAEFTHEEYADIIYIYGFTDGNAMAAQTEYQRRFPTRRIPDARVFSSALRRLRETGSASRNRRTSDRQAPGDVVLDEAVLRAVRLDPSLSIRRLALQFQVSFRTIYKLLHRENLHPFHATPVQGLLPPDMAQRLEFCNFLLEREFAEGTMLDKILWTDESQFTRDGITNFHNLHAWAPENPHLKKQTSFQHRFSVNVWAGVIGNNLIGPFILPPRLNSNNYLDFLQTQLPELLEDIPLLQRMNHYYQHDGAPCHYGTNVKNWLDATYPNRWIGRNGPIHWPARSPDLTVMDFFVWGTMKELVYATEITTLHELEQRIGVAAQKIRDKLLNIDIKRSIIKRLFACIQTVGDHFEIFL